jgi:hypothetical protein
MHEFKKRQDEVWFEYRSDYAGNAWVAAELRSQGVVTIGKIFRFERGDLLDDLPPLDGEHEGFTYRFRFGVRREGYVHIPGRILRISNPVAIADTIALERRIFAAVRDTSIFRRISHLIESGHEIVVGGDREGAIPESVYEELLKRFPNTVELDRYASARVATVLADYLDPMKDARSNYEAYLNRTRSTLETPTLEQAELLRAEQEKYVYIRDTILEWLKSSTNRSEKDWQAMIVNFLLLIFPKYIAVLQNVTISDYYSKPGHKTSRYIDLALVDAGGNLDVIEVKKPFENALVGRSLYRGNSVPAKELAGSIMQAEKYLFHLSKWGVEGEKKLSTTYSGELPPNLTIRVTSPKAMIILGRDRLADGSPALTPAQMFDLEVIKRKYANMMDIMTYDDLVRRLDNIIASLRTRAASTTVPAMPSPSSSSPVSAPGG